MKSSILKMKAAGAFEAQVKIYRTTQHHTPEDSNLHSHHHDSLNHSLMELSPS
jgi:hypothetical protein